MPKIYRPPYRIYNEDCLATVARLESNSVDTIITDPPYGLKFMGKNWDHGIPGVPFWRAFLRVAKPGAFLLAFGGSRTSHRLACAIEDAGWEIRDGIIWLYGQGFPKSHNISKSLDKAAGAEREVVGERYDGASITGFSSGYESSANTGKGTRGGVFKSDTPQNVPITAPATDAAKEWDGWGTALSPAHEPICVAMKPLDGTFAANAMKHGVAGLNIDGARIPTEGERPLREGLNHVESLYKGGFGGSKAIGTTPAGRWPKNVILSDDECVRELFPETTTGKLNRANITAENKTYGAAPKERSGTYEATSGSASRYFYTAKAGKSERGIGNNHPTVKPLALMGYLCKLTQTPTGGIVFDPFMGSGTTGVACGNLGRRFIGCENDLEHGYFEIAEERIREAYVKERDIA